MTESIALYAAQRQFLTARTQIFRARNEASDRLASGRRVSGITENPVNFLRSQALTNRVGALRDAKASIGQGISALQATNVGTRTIEGLTQQLKGIAKAAQNATSDERAELVKQFDTVRRQIDSLANDVSYQGVNLISSSPDKLDVATSDKPGVSLTIQGAASDAASLGIGDAAGYDNFATQAGIDQAIADIEGATAKVRANESNIVGNAAVLNIREDFTRNLANTLEGGTAKLTLADANEEAARLLSANVRDALSAQGLRITAQSDRSIVNLITGS